MNTHAFLLANAAILNIRQVNPEEIIKLIKLLTGAKNVFVYGVGRSGLVGKALVMRFMHLGLNVFFIGRENTRRASKGDVVILISSSGTTKSVIDVAETSKKIGVRIIAMTSHYTDTPLSELLDLDGKKGEPDVLIELKGKEIIEGYREENNKDSDIGYIVRQFLGLATRDYGPMGTVFEIAVLVFCDAFIDIFMELTGKDEKYMKELHEVYQI